MLAELEAAAADAGAYGVSKERYLRGGEAAAPLPPGAAWRTVSVRYARYDPGLPQGSDREGGALLPPGAAWRTALCEVWPRFALGVLKFECCRSADIQGCLAHCQGASCPGAE